MAEALHTKEESLEDLIETAFGFITLDSEQKSELRRLVQLLEHSQDRLRAKRFVEYLSLLPIDSATLIAGLAYCAIDEKLQSVERIKEKAARRLVSTLLNLASVDTAASTSALLQVHRNRSQTENVRRMLVDMIDDPRVIVLKLVERLVHLKEPAKHDEPHKVKTIAGEVLNFYAPLASRLGIWHLKWVLEDAAFQCLEPDRYRDIANHLAQRRGAREERVSQIQSDLSWRLKEARVSGEIQGRAKNIFGIDRKMKSKELSFSDIRDVTGIRVLVDSVPECYQVLGIVHTAWPHLSDEFDDYIANPKSNGYRSLHTAVYGPKGHIIEVQIRTHQMHLEAELGVCSHWEYKGTNHSSLHSEQVDWMREVLNWHEEFLAQDSSNRNPVKAAKTKRFVYVLTPKRHIVDLPAGSTVLDFAFKVHSEIGLNCVSARIDGEIAALNATLVTGNMVEIITDPESEPRRRWLDPDLAYYLNPKTRDILRSHFAAMNREINIEAGRKRLAEEITRLGLNKTIDEVLPELEADKPNEFLLAIALGTDNPRERLLNMEKSSSDEFNVSDHQVKTKTKCVNLVAVDRQGLARDITNTIAALKINVVGLNLGAPTLGEKASAQITIEVSSLAEASRVVVQLRRLRNVSDVWLSSD